MRGRFEQITSPQNSKVKLINRLRQKRGREQEGLFVIDYERDLERALEQGFEVEFAMITPESLSDPLSATLSGSDTYEVPSTIMSKASYRENPSGIVAVMRAKPLKSAEELLNSESSLVLGLVNLQKPGNIGALLRTADATGFDAILLIDTQLDLYNPNIIRSSTGTCFLDNIYAMNTTRAIDVFKAKDMQIISAYVDGDKTLYDVDLCQNTAILLGTEDKGLSQQWVTTCDHLVTIPMAGRISDSLNVSVSGAIFMYEALRQRHYT